MAIGSACRRTIMTCAYLILIKHYLWKSFCFTVNLKWKHEIMKPNIMNIPIQSFLSENFSSKSCSTSPTRNLNFWDTEGDIHMLFIIFGPWGRGGMKDFTYPLPDFYFFCQSQPHFYYLFPFHPILKDLKLNGKFRRPSPPLLFFATFPPYFFCQSPSFFCFHSTPLRISNGKALNAICFGVLQFSLFHMWCTIVVSV